MKRGVGDVAPYKVTCNGGSKPPPYDRIPISDIRMECYTISRVDKNPKYGIIRGEETQKEGEKNDDLQQRIQRRSDPAVR